MGRWRRMFLDATLHHSHVGTFVPYKSFAQQSSIPSMVFRRSVLRCLPLFLLLFAVLNCFGQSVAQWPTFSSKAGGFTVSLPGVPSESTVSTPFRTVTAKLMDASSYNSATLFRASVTFLPGTIGNADEADNYFTSQESALLGTKTCNLNATIKEGVQGLPARRLVMSCKRQDRPTHEEMLLVFAGNRTFDLAVVCTGPEQKSNIDRFFSSLKIDRPNFVGRGEWSTLSPNGWQFSYDMPGIPEESDSPVQKGKLYLASGGVFVVAVGTIIPAWPREKAATYFDQKELGTERVYGARIAGRRDLLVQGMPARRLWVAFTKDITPHRADLLLIFAGNRFYALQVDRKTTPGNLEPKDVERFFNSLVVKNAVFGYGL